MSGPQEIIVDAGPLIALARKRDSKHKECVEILKKIPPTARLLTTASVIAEVFAVLPPGAAAVEAVSALLLGIPITLAHIQQHELDRAFELMLKYADLPMDYADAELVIVSERMKIGTIFTLDKRDFSIYRPKHIRHLQILA